MYIDARLETGLHDRVAGGTARLVLAGVEELIQAALSDRLRYELENLIVTGRGGRIYAPRRLLRQPDWSLGRNGDSLPSLVCEVRWGQTWQAVENKAAQYIKYSGGKIQAVLVIDAGFPAMRKATASLYVAGGWAPFAAVFYQEDLVEQPTGHIGLFVSDLVAGEPALPPSLSRPSPGERSAGASRYVLFFSFFPTISPEANRLCFETVIPTTC